MLFTPDDYDAKGQLRLPLAFWLILILQSRTWILFVMAGASRQQGDTLLALFYPDTQAFWSGLALGLPAVIAFMLTGYRQRFPRLWAAWRGVLMVTLVAMLGLQAQVLIDGEALTPLLALTLLADLLALGWLTFNRRLKACFRADLSL